MDIKYEKRETAIDRLLRMPRTPAFEIGGRIQSWVGEEFGPLETGETRHRVGEISGRIKEEEASVFQFEIAEVLAEGSYGAVVIAKIKQSYRKDIWTELDKMRDEETRPGIFKRNVVAPLTEAKKIICDCIMEENPIAKENAFSLLLSYINSVWEYRHLLKGHKKGLLVRLKALCIAFLRAGLDDNQYDYFSLLIESIVQDEDVSTNEYRALIRKGLEVGLRTTDLLKIEGGWYPEDE